MLSRIVLLIAAVPFVSGCIVVANVNDPAWWDDSDEITRDISIDVDRVNFEARGTLYVVQGRSNRLRIQGHNQALQQIAVDDRSGALLISQETDDFRWWGVQRPGSEAVFYLELENLSSLRHSGHGEVNLGPLIVNTLSVISSGHATTNFSSLIARDLTIRATDHANVDIETLDSDSAELRVNDHADIFVQDINVLDVKLRAADHGDLRLAGTADTAFVSAKDHANIDAGALESAVVNLNTRNHAQVTTQAHELIEIDERDNSSVSWTGSALQQ